MAVAALHRFRGGVGPMDDVTVIVLERVEAEP
jgi:hypothetical protein